MDPLTQGLLGGSLALASADAKHARRAAGIGAVAGMLADIDILIHSPQDPLLNVEFHRHFTHSLVFVPLGALLAAALLWPLLRRGMDFGRIYLFALLGYATGGLLDACTSYGTHLLWPFSETRFAWSIIAIVDPVFTLVLLIGLVAGLRYRRVFPARTGLALAGAYLVFGLLQHDTALERARELAAARGHEIDQILVKPTLANLVLWRSVYRSGDDYHVDAIRLAPGPERIYPGGAVRAFDLERDLPDLPRDSVVAGDIERFLRLSEGFVVADPGREGVLSDIRYAMLPTGTAPMWGLDLNVESDSQHAAFVSYRDRPDDYRERFVAMLLGRYLADVNSR